jgi:hypothetical protein
MAIIRQGYAGQICQTVYEYVISPGYLCIHGIVTRSCTLFAKDSCQRVWITVKRRRYNPIQINAIVHSGIVNLLDSKLLNYCTYSSVRSRGGIEGYSTKVIAESGLSGPPPEMF